MAQIQGLFGTSSPSKIKQDYLNQFLVSPAQMGQQGLLQQVVSLMSNAGANIGAQGSSMLGGKLAGEIEASYLEDSLAQVEKMNLKNEADKMAALGDLLAQKPGMGRQAMLARQEAVKLKKQDYEMGAMDRAQQLRKAIAAIPADVTGAERATAVKQAIRQFGSTDQQLALLPKTPEKTKVSKLLEELANTTPGTPEHKALTAAIAKETQAPATSLSPTAKLLAELKNATPGTPEHKALSDALEKATTTPGEAPPLIVKLQNALQNTTPGSKEAREIQARIDALGRGNVADTPPVNIGISDINSMMTNVRAKLGGSEEIINTAEQGLGLLKLGNPKAQAQVDRALASLSKDSQISALEVNMTSNAGPLGQQIVDTLNKIFVGGSGANSKLEKQHVLEASLIHNTLKYNTSRDNMIAAFGTANMTKDQITKIVGPRKELPKDLIGRFVVASGEEFEPTKFDYRMLNNGAIVRSPKKK